MSVSVLPSDWLTLLFRLVLALLLGATIGAQRQRQHKVAGLRTHMLVSLGAAIFVMIPQLIGASGSDGVSRAIQGIATGVGFLGAGEILQMQHGPEDHSSAEAGSGKDYKIVGLTSAAALWVTAALGIVAGCGLWQLGLLAGG